MPTNRAWVWACHLSRRYLDLLGGEISFESQEGKGTVFTVRFPAVSAP